MTMETFNLVVNSRLYEFCRHIFRFALYNRFWKTLSYILDKHTTTMLDIGSGRGDVMRLIRKHYALKLAVGCDISPELLRCAKSNRCYDELVLCDVRFLPFKPKAFDTVLCTDVIEHLEKKDGVRLIDEMEQFAKKQVVISTPIGLVPPADEALGKHICGWKPQMLMALGFSNFRGRDYFLWDRIVKRNNFALFTLTSTLAFLINILTAPLVSTNLSIAYCMMCTKDLW